MSQETFLTETQTLLMISGPGAIIQSRYILESEFFGAQYREAKEVLDLIDDSVARIVRFDDSNLATADVTEEVATAFLERYDRKYGLSIEDGVYFPAYARQSMAWKRWKDDLEAERPVERGPNPDYVHDQRRESALQAAE